MRTRASLAGLGVVIAVALASLLGAVPAGATELEPVLVDGNVSCTDLRASWTGLKVEPVTDGVRSDGTLSVTLSNVDGTFFDWTASGGVDAVLVKGGTDTNQYLYEPPQESLGDVQLHAPINSNNGLPYGLSHVEFCYDEDGTIIVEKRTEPAGSSQAFTFTSQLAPSGFALTDGTSLSFTDLPAGSYEVTEGVTGGWSLSAIEFSDTNSAGGTGSGTATVALEANEVVRVIFRNVKTTTPPDGGPGDTGGSAPSMGTVVPLPGVTPDLTGVLGERALSGVARLLGAKGCVTGIYRARVRGRQIRLVRFYLHGKLIRTVRKPDRRGDWAVEVGTRALRVGPHRLAAKVYFTKASRTSAKTMRLTFLICARSLAAPKFTG